MINIDFIFKKLPNQPPEYYYGNKEYKITLDYKKKINIYNGKKGYSLQYD